MKPTPIGILVSSDRAFTGVYQDKGAPAITTYLTNVLTTPWRAIVRIVPDERDHIENALKHMADVDSCPLIVTTGGTGPARRDVTPEATTAVCDRVLPGFGEVMRAASLAEVPTAILSRQLAGSRNATLIVNLPGKAIGNCDLSRRSLSRDPLLHRPVGWPAPRN